MKKECLNLIFETVFMILMIFSFYLLFFFDWNGLQRGAVLAAYIVLMAFFYRKKQSKLQIPAYFKKIAYFLIIAAFLLNMTYNVWFYEDNLTENYLYEGKTSVLASSSFFKSYINPYEEKTDPSAEIDIFSGYKYMPLMFLLYSPFTLVFGKMGILYLNILVYIGFLIVAYFLIKRIHIKDDFVYLKYIFLFLLCYVITFELFYQGVNDLIPAFFVLCSLAFFFHKKEVPAGIFIGLSIAAKPFPGIFLFLLFLLNKRFRLAIYSVITAAIFIVPFVLWNFWAFFLNTIYFNVLRHANPSSVYYFMPEIVKSVWFFLLLFLIWFLCYGWIKSNKKPIDLLYYFTLLSTVFLLMNKVTHRNYLIWVLPFILIVLSKRIEFISSNKN